MCQARPIYRTTVPPVGGCFVAGTLVHTKDGLVPIEQVKVGDWVLSQPEMKGEVGYKRVARTFSFEDLEVVSVDVWRPDTQERAGFVVTSNHPFWVKDLGWTRADYLEAGQFLELADGRTCQVFNSSTVYRTDVEGVGWLDGYTSGIRGSGDGRTIDMRGGAVVFNYEHVAHTEIDPADRENYLRTRVYNFEVEDNHTYYVGEWGVWVHNANCQVKESLQDIARVAAGRDRTLSSHETISGGSVGYSDTCH
jgi:hypothetical protein